MLGAMPTAQSAAWIVSALGYSAPPTMTSAAPMPTRHAFPSPAGRRGRGSSFPEFALQGFLHGRIDEMRYITAEAGDLAHQARAEIGQLKCGPKKDGLDLGGEVAVHQRHLEFVLEVRDGPQATNDHRGPDLLRELGEQALERLHLDAFVRHRLLDQRDAFVKR